MKEVILQTYYILLPIVATALIGWTGVQAKKQGAIAEGVKILLRQRLFSMHEKLMDKGFVTYDENEDFKETYEAYHALGGNGYATHMWEDVKKLEVRP